MSSVAEMFLSQSEHCDNLGSPFTAGLCRMLADKLDDNTAVGRHVRNWMGNPSLRADGVPLRLIGGLHAIVLSKQDKELARAYPPNTDRLPDWELIEKALIGHEAFLLEWMKSPPQTNEVQRSNAIWPSLRTIAGATKLPLVLWEIGASAGLNLQLDRFRFDHGGQISGDEKSAVRLLPEWEGSVPQGDVEIIGKAACDLNPLDPFSADDRLRLLSYVWAGQNDRVERTRGTLALAQAHPVSVDKMDALDWLREKLGSRTANACTVIYTTIAWQYLPDDAKAEGEAMIRKAGEAAALENPLAQLHMEGDGEAPGAAITLKLWPHNIDCQLGRVDFHGRWVRWDGLPKPE